MDSVLNQESVEETYYEIIVVNDSGTVLPDAAWQHTEHVTIIETSRRERSVARNAGAAIARGDYLHFLDDDDWLAPDALSNFRRLAAASDAGWLYGASQVVDRQHMPLVQLHQGVRGNGFLQTMAGEWIPLQASLIKSEIFFEIGGFDPLLAGPEDIDLLRRAALRSDLAETSALVATVVMGDTGSSTDYSTHHVGSRWAREKILDAPGTFPRLRQGANNSFWHGRLLRIYLTSVVWNLQNRRLFTALGRALHSVAALLAARLSLFSKEYWSAVVTPYRSPAFAVTAESVGKEAGSVTDQG